MNISKLKKRVKMLLKKDHSKMIKLILSQVENGKTVFTENGNPIDLTAFKNDMLIIFEIIEPDSGAARPDGI